MLQDSTKGHIAGIVPGGGGEGGEDFHIKRAGVLVGILKRTS